MNRIKQLRKSINMTQDELAQKLHLKRSVISKYENGLIPLTDLLIVQLSDIFNVSSDYLLGKSDDPTPIDKKSPLSKEKGDLMLTQALKGTPLLDADDQLTEKGKKIISDFITNNVDMLKQLMNEPE